MVKLIMSAVLLFSVAVKAEGRQGRQLSVAEVETASMVDARDFEFSAKRMQSLLQESYDVSISSLDFKRTSTEEYETKQSVFPGMRTYDMAVTLASSESSVCKVATMYDKAATRGQDWPEFLIFECSLLAPESGSVKVSAWQLGWRSKATGLAYFWD